MTRIVTRFFLCAALSLCANVSLHAAQGWNFIDAGTTVDLNAIAYNYPSFVVVGDGGTILVSNDFGSTWSAVSSGTTENLNGIYYDGEMTTYMAVGDNGTILYSEDGGSTWTAAATSPTGVNLHAVQGTYGSTWYAVGDNMSVYRTSNSGQDWGLLTTAGGSGNLYGIGMDEYTGDIMVGGDGGYYATFDGEVWTENSLPESVTINQLYPDYWDGTHAMCSGGVVFRLPSEQTPAKTSAAWEKHKFREDHSIYTYVTNGDGTWSAAGENGSVYDLGNTDNDGFPVRKLFESGESIFDMEIDGTQLIAVGSNGLLAMSTSWKTCDYGVIYASGTDPVCHNDANGSVTLDSVYLWSSYYEDWSFYQYEMSNGQLPADKYYVTVTNDSQCYLTDSVELINPPMITVDAGEDQDICYGQSTQLVATGGSSYTWGPTASNSATPIFSPTDTTKYYVTATNVNGCVNIDSVTVNVLPTPTLSYQQYYDICGGDTVQFSVSGADEYVWNTQTNMDDSTLAQPSVWPEEEYVDYMVTATASATGCQTIETIYVYVTPRPEINLVDDTICFGEEYTIYATMDMQSPFEFDWSTEDYGTSITVSEPGQYSVEGYSPEVGCPTFDTMNLVVINTPQTALKDTHFCAGSSVLLDPGAFETYLWNTGATTATIDASVAGEYSVTVTEPFGCAGADTIMVMEETNPTVMLKDSSICENDAMALDAGAGFIYNWSTGEVTQTIAPSSTGDYSVTITDEMGCKAVDTMAFVRHTNPIVDLQDAAICSGDSVELDPGITGTYEWSTGETAPLVYMDQAGDYHVTVTDLNGCTDRDTMTLLVHQLPILELGPDVQVCEGDEYVLQADAGFSLYNWSNGSDQSSFQVTETAEYILTVTDENGCAAVDTVSIFFNPLPFVDLQSIDVCEGTEVTFDAGPGASMYLWSNDSTTQSIVVSEAGSYAVTVVDNMGCMSSDTAELGVITPATGIAEGKELCEGDTVILNGGNFETYVWSTGETTATIEVPVVKDTTYFITATDINDCEVPGYINLIVSSKMIVTVEPTLLSCHQSGDGMASVSVEGGKDGYSFEWNTGETTPILTSLDAGAYQVTVMDDFLCMATGEVLVNEPGEMSSLMTVVNAVCTAANGSAQATTLGGTPDYQYAWSSGAITQTATGLAPGQHVVTVTDANGCILTDTVIVGQTDSLITIGTSSISTTCDGPHGAVFATASGGTENFSYNWSGGYTSESVEGLTKGVYSVTASDENGCSATDEVEVANEDVELAVTVSTTNSSCEQSDGGATASVEGATGNVVYAWSNGSDAESISAVPAGAYTVSVTDSLGCLGVGSNVVTDLNGPEVSLDSIVNSECNQADGQIAIIATGGTGDLTYAWSNGSSNPTATKLAPGTYSIEVSDVNGCIGGLSAKVVTNGTIAPVVQGTVVSSLQGDTVNQAKVTMIQYNTKPGTLPKFKSVSVDENGFFEFTNVWVDDYILLVTPDTNFHKNTFKTFFPNVARWDSAHVVSTSCGDTTELEVIVKQVFALNGKAKIRGIILKQLKDLLAKTGSITGEPIPGISVSLEQIPGGIVAQTSTDEDGIYLFDNVPPGDYQIFVDIPGLPMDSTYNVNIPESEEDTTVVDLDFLVDTTSSVYIEKVVQSSVWEKTLSQATVRAYPNPFNDQLTLTFELGAGMHEVSIQLTDITGKVMHQEHRQFSAGSTSFSLEMVEELAPGMWLIKGAIDGEQFSAPVIKMK